MMMIIIFYQGKPHGGSKITKISYNICLMVHPTLACRHLQRGQKSKPVPNGQKIVLNRIKTCE